MFDIGEPTFIFAEEEIGNALRVYIPGKVPNDRPTYSVKWTGVPTPLSREAFKKAANKFRQKIKKDVSLKTLPQREIPGYSTNYEYAVGYMTGNSIAPDLNRLTYIRNDVAYDLRHGLWFPLLKVLQERIANYDYIQVDLPVLPQITTEYFVQEWFENNQAAKQFQERLQTQSDKTCIEGVFSDKEIIYRVSHHPFVNQPVKRFRVFPSENIQARQPADFEMDMVWKQVSARDVYFLKGLTDNERKQFAHQSSPKNNFGYQIHWIQPLSLGGAIHKSNAIFVRSDKENLYRCTVQVPLEKFLKEYRDKIIAFKKSIFVDLQVPNGDYRGTPIRVARMRPQNRQALKRSLRAEMREREE